MTNYQGVVKLKDVTKVQNRRFLKKADLSKELRLTIGEVLEEDVALEDAAEKLRFVVYFLEIEKDLILKWNLAKAIESVTGSSDMDSWAGQHIVVYHDPDVCYQGRKVGGIRVRPFNRGVT